MVFVRVIGNQRYVSRKFIRRKILEQIGIRMAYLHVFLVTMDEIDHGTIIQTGVTCKNIPCYMRDSACR